MTATVSPHHVWAHRNRGAWVALTSTGERRANRTAVLADGPARDASCRHVTLEAAHGAWLEGQQHADPFACPLDVRTDIRLVLAISSEPAVALRTVANWSRETGNVVAIDERDPMAGASADIVLDDVAIVICAAPR
jgi:hypothetical protein